MYIRTKKPKNKILIAIISSIIILTILILCVQTITNHNFENTTSIIAGRDISKNQITQTIDQFDWEQDVDSTIGSITIEDDGKTVHMTGNEMFPGKNAIYIIPESHQQQIFSFDYNIEFGDSFISAGVLIRVKKEVSSDGEEIIEGYMVSFNNDGEEGSQPQGQSGEFYNESGNKLGAIWKFSLPIGLNSSIYADLWRMGDYSNCIQKTLVKGLDLPQSGSMTITSNPNQIVITGTNINEIIDISLDDDIGEGFGFFTNHYAHSCNQIGEFNLTNFAVTVIDIEPHNLYIEPNGGVWNGSSAVSTIEGEYGDEVDIPLPTRPGYNFAGWTQTGNSGTMSSLTEDAIYTFGEDAETDDTITAQWTKVDVIKECRIDTGEDYGDIVEPGNTDPIKYVVEGQQIIFELTATNTGTVDATALIKDSAPEGTTFVENSIKVNNEDTSYTETDLENGISIPVSKDTSSKLSFKVKINELTNGDIIRNTALYKDVTISEETEEKESNEVQFMYFNTYGEPIVTQTKTMETETGENYVVSGEKITYKITVKNNGLLPEDVIIKDTIPEGTTFVEESIKLNDSTYTEDGIAKTVSDLKNGIILSIPAETSYTLSFDVTVNDDLEDGITIENIATVNDISTNTASIEYSNPYTNPDDEPNDNPDDNPNNNPDDEPNDNPDDNPNNNPDDEPNDNPDDNPNNNPDDEPDDNPDNNPDDEPDDNPDNNPDDEPDDNQNDNQDDDSNNNQNNNSNNNNTNNNQNNNSNNNSNINTGNNSNSTNNNGNVANNGNTTGNEDTTTAKEDIPKTGIRNILIIIVVMSLGTSIFYIRYKKLNSYVK